jgi:MscS family membrane protein
VATNLSNWPVSIQDTAHQFSLWVETLDHTKLIISVVAIVVVYIFRKRIARLCVSTAGAIFQRLSITLSDHVKSELVKTTEVLLISVVILLIIEFMGASELAGGVLRRLVLSVAVIAVFGSLYHLSNTFLAVLRMGRFSNTAVDSELVQSVTKFVILLFCINAVLGLWNIDINGVLTGVGVFGAGVAVAAKDPIQNLMSGMSNMSEKRFSTGDSIEIEGVLIGTVQKIDLRSTLIVGFDQIPRHVPNSELANSIVMNLSKRKHRRIRLKIPLVLSSTQEQVEEVRDRLKDYLDTSGDFVISDESPQYVHVNDLGESSIDILYYAWTQTAEYAEYLKVKERLSLNILSIIETAGSNLAYPTQTIHTDHASLADNISEPISSNS